MIACLSYGDSCLNGAETSARPRREGAPTNLRQGVDRDRTAIEWKFRNDPNEWKSLWDGQTFAGWDHAGIGLASSA